MLPGGQADDQRAEFAEGDPAVDEVARLARQLAPAGADVVGQWMRRLEELLADATSTDDLQQLILDAFGELPEAELVDFHRTVAKVCAILGLTGDEGFRAITNAGAHGMQEVPHYHMHILGGRSLGRMLERG